MASIISTALSVMHDWLEAPFDIVHDILTHAAFKVGCATIGATVLNCVGGSWASARALLVLMCVDFFLGFYRAWTGGTVSARKLRKGLAKFLFYALSIMCAHHVDAALNDKFEHIIRAHSDFTGFLILYLVLCEGISAFNHLYCLGVPVPKRLISKLETLRDCQVPGSKKNKSTRGES